MPGWIPINWGLLKHPLNWLTVTLMVIIVAFAAELLLSHFAPTQGDN